MLKKITSVLGVYLYVSIVSFVYAEDSSITHDVQSGEAKMVTSNTATTKNHSHKSRGKSKSSTHKSTNSRVTIQHGVVGSDGSLKPIWTKKVP